MAFLQIFPPGAEIVADIAPRSPHQVVLNTTTLRLVWRDQHVGRDEERSVLTKGFICHCWRFMYVVEAEVQIKILKFPAQMNPFLSWRHHVVCLVPHSEGNIYK